MNSARTRMMQSPAVTSAPLLEDDAVGATAWVGTEAVRGRKWISRHIHPVCPSAHSEQGARVVRTMAVGRAVMSKHSVPVGMRCTFAAMHAVACNVAREHQ
eukprot:Opistho-2@66585